MTRAVVTERVAVARTGNAAIDRAIDEVVRPVNDLLRRQAEATGSQYRDLKHGDMTMMLLPASGNGSQAALNTTGFVVAANGSANWIQTLPIRVGDRIKHVDFWHDRASSGTSDFKLQRIRMLDGSLETLFTISVTSGTSYERVGRDYTHVVVDGYGYQVEWDAAASSDRYYGAEILYDRP